MSDRRPVITCTRCGRRKPRSIVYRACPRALAKLLNAMAGDGVASVRIEIPGNRSSPMVVRTRSADGVDYCGALMPMLADIDEETDFEYWTPEPEGDEAEKS